MKLTNTTCQNAKSKEKPYKLTDGQGLYLEIMPNGAKYWRYKFRFGKKEKRLALGVYCQPRAIGGFRPPLIPITSNYRW